MLSLVLSLASLVTPPAGAAERPITSYVKVDPPSRMYDVTQGMVLYMNRHGGTYTCAQASDNAANNLSTIACGATNGTAVVTPFAGTDEQWSTVLSCIQNLYAPFHLPVTDVQPLDGQYIEAVIGGSPEQAGQPAQVAGVAPFSCAVEPGAIVYDFSDVWGNDLESICETAGQEVAHAFGLDHEFLCQDPMTYLTGCGNKTFQDEFVPCGEYQPRECNCNTPTQNSVQSMLTLFGPADGSVYTPPVDHAPPTIAISSPSDAAIMPAYQPIVITATASDDAGLTELELEWDFSGEHMFCPAADATTGDYTCERSGNTVTWTVQGGIGSRTFRGHVRDIAGNDVVTPDVKVWLSPDGNGPPNDTNPPVVMLGSPLSGSVLPTATKFDVVATMVDDTGIALGELNWQRGGTDNWVPCPANTGRISCVVNGSTYKWTVQSSRAGDRVFQLRATDMVGNVTVTDLQTITLQAGVALPPVDDNNSIDAANTLTCGSSVDLTGASTDWFKVDTAPGSQVTVNISGDGIVVATNGKSVLGQASSGSAAKVAVSSELDLAVVPSSAGGGGSHVSITCIPPKKPAPKAKAPSTFCGATGTAPVFALFALVGLVRRRR